MVEEINKDFSNAGKEFELAWQEFFKNKPKPKNDEEERKKLFLEKIRKLIG